MEILQVPREHVRGCTVIVDNVDRPDKSLIRGDRPEDISNRSRNAEAADAFIFIHAHSGHGKRDHVEHEILRHKARADERVSYCKDDVVLPFHPV